MVFKRYLGLKSDYNSFQANTFSEFLEVYKEWVLSPFKNNSFPKVEILINLENLKNLDNQRTYGNNEETRDFVNARIKIYGKNDEANKIINVKVRSKGARKYCTK